MNIEKLKQIRARCVELLAIAEKRTPGEWHVDSAHGVIAPTSVPIVYPFGTPEEEINDARFIASCAGAAEASWRSTIAAINNLELIHESTDLGEYAAWDGLQDILAAWPDELLRNSLPKTEPLNDET